MMFRAFEWLGARLDHSGIVRGIAESNEVFYQDRRS